MTTQTSTPTDDGMRVRNETTNVVHAEIPGGTLLTYCGMRVAFNGFLTEEDNYPVSCKTCQGLI